MSPFTSFHTYEMKWTLYPWLVKMSDSVSNKLDADHYVEPDLGPNCRQRLSTNEKSHHKQAKS